MLVLARKAGQSILIGGDIEVKFLDCRGETVRLGITAPADTRVLRGELADQEDDAVEPTT